VQGQFAFFNALPCSFRAPAQKDFTQIPDRDIDGRLESDLVIGTVVDPVLTQYKYFRTHASPHESLGRQNGEQALTSRDSADRSAELMIPAATERRF
jgi:hypothetical protein